MTSGKKMAIGAALVGVLAIGGEILYLHHERNLPVQMAGQQERALTDPDDLVFLKKERPSTPADLKDLVGQTIWVSAGGQMDYYPASGHHTDYGKTVGTLLGAEPLIVKDVFEQVAPKSAGVRIPQGDKQVLLGFTMPKSSDPSKEYAVPVGYKQGGDYTFYTDDIFFYVDPHQLYQHWGPAIWQAVDSHQVILGMNTRQVQLALGQIYKGGGDKYGEGEAVYYNNDHPIDVTFVKNKVTAIHPE
jgi:hypothetical protein